MTCAPLPTVPSSAMVLARGLSSVSVRAIERMRLRWVEGPLSMEPMT
jgi:hypothetical protein